MHSKSTSLAKIGGLRSFILGLLVPSSTRILSRYSQVGHSRTYTVSSVQFFIIRMVQLFISRTKLFYYAFLLCMGRASRSKVGPNPSNCMWEQGMQSKGRADPHVDQRVPSELSHIAGKPRDEAGGSDKGQQTGYY
jgi:hypothetical protein